MLFHLIILIVYFLSLVDWLCRNICIIVLHMCRAVPDDVMSYSMGADANVQTLYNWDPLSIVSSLYADFSALLQVRCGLLKRFVIFKLVWVQAWLNNLHTLSQLNFLNAYWHCCFITTQTGVNYIVLKFLMLPSRRLLLNQNHLCLMMTSSTWRPRRVWSQLFDSATRDTLALQKYYRNNLTILFQALFHIKSLA